MIEFYMILNGFNLEDISERIHKNRLEITFSKVIEYFRESKQVYTKMHS